VTSIKDGDTVRKIKVLTAVALVLAAAAYVLNGSDPASARDPRATTASTPKPSCSPGLDSSISSNCEWVALSLAVAIADPEPRLLLVDGDGSNSTVLVTGLDARSPDFAASANRKAVAFSCKGCSGEGSGGSSDGIVWIFPSGPRRVSRPAGRTTITPPLVPLFVPGTLPGDSSPSAAPDGRVVVVAAGAGGAGGPAAPSLVVIDPDGMRRQLRGTAGPLGDIDSHPSFSPDGSMIAFSQAAPGGGRDIFTIFDRWGNLVFDPPALAAKCAPQTCLESEWSPDATKLLVGQRSGDCPRSSARLAWFDPRDPGKATAVAGTRAGDIRASWSSDGSVLVVANCNEGSLRYVGATTVNQSVTREILRKSLAMPEYLNGRQLNIASARPMPPVFSDSSGCGTTVAARVFGEPTTLTLTAMSGNSGDTGAAASQRFFFQSPGWTFTRSPTWAKLTPTGETGETSSAKLELRPGIFDFLVGIFVPSDPIVVQVTDEGTSPPLSSTCSITPRVVLF
jgi:hypothetical protein